MPDLMYAHTLVAYEGDDVGHCELCGLSADSADWDSECPELAR